MPNRIVKQLTIIFFIICVCGGLTPYLCEAATLTKLSQPIGQPGDVITITGAGFSTDPSLNDVRFGPNRAPVRSASSTQLVVQIPNGQPLGPTSVKVSIQGGPPSNGVSFITTMRSKIVLPPNPPRCESCCENQEGSGIPCTSMPANLGGKVGGRRGNIYSERGEFFQYDTELVIPGRPGADPMLFYTFLRRYRSQIDTDGPLGHNWNHNYFERLEVKTDGSIVDFDGLGRADHYLLNNLSEFVSPPEFYTQLIKRPDGKYELH